ncbi:MAG TPA: hypothetical protein VJQ56_01730 [Blastocatellia bacterium]|nr:hypothetical protein [Blastocatellia bacterium]
MSSNSAAVVGREENVSGSTEREAGDEVNRFLLCSLVSQSAKRVKARAETEGEFLPMTAVVRGVLRAYRAAIKVQHEALAGFEADAEKLKDLNTAILKEELKRHRRERVETGKMRVDQAARSGDEAKVKTERDGLERALAARDRFSR